MPSHIEVLSPETSHRSPLLNMHIDVDERRAFDNEQRSLSLSHDLTFLDDELQDQSLVPADQGLAFNPSVPNLDLLSFRIGERPFRHINAAQTALADTISASIPSDIFTMGLDSRSVAYSSYGNLLEEQNNPMDNSAQSPFQPTEWIVFDDMALYPAMPTPVPDSLLPSRLSSPYALSDSGNDRENHAPCDSMREPVPSADVLFYGTNPEDAIQSVQMLRTLVQCLQDQNFLRSHVSLYGSSSTRLVDEIQSERFLSGLRNITLWVYQASAEFVKKQGIARQHHYSDSLLSSRQTGDGDRTSSSQGGSIPEHTRSLRLASSVTSRCDVITSCTTGGTLRIELRQTPKAASEDEASPSYYVAISAIPEVRSRREAGICITLPSNAHTPLMYPTIRTFNVVPEDSEIIECVRMNDLAGFRRMMENGEGSPRDVNPDGISLLYVSLMSSKIPT